MELYMARQGIAHDGDGEGDDKIVLRKYYERDAAYLALIDSFIQVLIISWILLHLEKSYPGFSHIATSLHLLFPSLMMTRMRPN